MGQTAGKPFSGDIQAENIDNIDHSVFSFLTNRGQKLFAQSWVPSKSKPVGVVFLVPGLGDYSDRLKRIAIHLATNHSLSVFSHDHISHGRSEGEGVEYFSDFSFIVEDLKTYFNFIREKYPECETLPRFIYGHSMGGLVAAYFLTEQIQSYFSGVILHAPPCANPSQATPTLVFIARSITHILPEQSIEPLDTTTLIRDPVEKAKYDNDPLAWHGGVRAQTAISLLDATSRALEIAKRIVIPLMYIQGTLDTIVPAEAAEPFFKTCPSKDKIFYKLIGGFHENHSDYEKDIVFKFIGEWIAKKITSKSCVEENSEIKEIDVSCLNGQ